MFCFFFFFKFNDCFVAYITEEKEREKESGSVPENGGETPAKENGVKEEKKKNKKKKKKNKKSDEKEENGEDVTDEVEHENDEDAEELDFWMPPDGERWDFDDGRDRWGSDSDPEEEKNGEKDPIGLFTCVSSHALLTATFNLMLEFSF